jgi:TRAP-type C4-dicarboxylate transport system permease small subunit
MCIVFFTQLQIILQVFQRFSQHPSLFSPAEVLNFLFAGVVSSANGGILASQGRTSLSAKMATRCSTGDECI